MRVDRAMAIVKAIGLPRRGHRQTVSHALTYQPPVPQRRWTWETATPHERACFVRENRKIGLMDWDLLKLFCLTRDGLAAIVRGKDWDPSHSSGDGQ